MGLKRAGFRVAAAVELDAHAAGSFMLNHRDTVVLNRDIRSVRADELRKAAQLGRRRLDLLTGCPPCQGFSSLRTRRRAASVPDDRNDLLLEFLRLVQTLRPRAIILENVPGLADDRTFQVFCSSLKEMNYGYFARVLDASDFGVPQRRRRLVLAAIENLSFDPAWLAPGRARPTTVRDAIGSLDSAGRSGDALHDYPEQRSLEVLARIRAVPRNGGSRSDLPSMDQLACHKRSSGFFDVYGRMAWSQLSPTITSGCTNPSKGRFIHPEKHRAITLREAALLQTFPKNYRFDLSRGKEHVAAQIGNAFPPKLIVPLARRIAGILQR